MLHIIFSLNLKRKSSERSFRKPESIKNHEKHGSRVVLIRLIFVSFSIFYFSSFYLDIRIYMYNNFISSQSYTLPNTILFLLVKSFSINSESQIWESNVSKIRVAISGRTISQKNVKPHAMHLRKLVPSSNSINKYKY